MYLLSWDMHSLYFMREWNYEGSMILFWVCLNLSYLWKSKPGSSKKFLTVPGLAGIFILGDSLILKGCIFQSFFFALPFKLCCRRGESGWSWEVIGNWGNCLWASEWQLFAVDLCVNGWDVEMLLDLFVSLSLISFKLAFSFFCCFEGVSWGETYHIS